MFITHGRTPSFPRRASGGVGTPGIMPVCSRAHKIYGGKSIGPRIRSIPSISDDENRRLRSAGSDRVDAVSSGKTMLLQGEILGSLLPILFIIGTNYLAGCKKEMKNFAISPLLSGSRSRISGELGIKRFHLQFETYVTTSSPSSVQLRCRCSNSIVMTSNRVA